MLKSSMRRPTRPGVCQFAQQTNAKGDDGGLQQISGHDQLAAKEIVDIKLEEQNEIDAC